MSYSLQGFEDGQILTAEKLIQMENGIVDAYAGIKYVESHINGNPMVNFRDLPTGIYRIVGYFSPYANSNISMGCDDLIHVERKTAGTHIICLGALNAKIVFIEILVDDTNPKGFTYTKTSFSLFELQGLISRVEALEAAIGAAETAAE